MHEFWRGKRVLVTGHTGFVGAWLCTILKYFGAKVTGFSLEEEFGSLFGKIKNDIRIESIYGDLRDVSAINLCIDKCNPEIIFHIAAFGFVKECKDNPIRAYSCNVMGTANLLESLKLINRSVRVIIASSDKVYMNKGSKTYLFSEDDPLGSYDPYSATKTCEDITSRSYYDTYLKDKGCSMCVVRPSNILGGGDHINTRLIPSIYRNIQRGEKPQIRNPSSVRPWQHILDITDAYITLAEKIDCGCHIYNVGPEVNGIKTVGEIVNYIMGLYGTNDYIENNNTSAVVDTHDIEKKYLGLSIDKIKSEIGWRPRKTLEQTLDDIYDFYNGDRHQSTYELCLSQIKRYYNRI